MRYIKAIKFILAIAGLLFVAKPFLGFKAYHRLCNSNCPMLLAKAFTQRKPEFLEESEKEQSAFHYKLSNPPHKNSVSIALLLSLLFPSAFIVRTLLEKSRPSGTLSTGDAGNKTYLLTGKLTI